MSKVKELTEYLIGGNSFLLKDSNNGKTIMLSGSWGAGKTHFWKNIIEPEISKQLIKKESACVYVSLYGKDSLETLKNEILFKAYEFQNTDNEIDKVTSKAISAFGFGASIISSLPIGIINADSSKITSTIKNIFEGEKLKKAQEYINNGGVICLDDFERKSKNIDLNDLFGFISQLSLEMNCKVIIILNSDIFEGRERNLFKQVKEKTINKFFNYSPSAEQLFSLVFDSKKYSLLEEHRDIILKTIVESKEINARIYIQILDNCLEWIEENKEKGALRALILSTINFIKNHFIFNVKQGNKKPSKFEICEMYNEYIEIYHFLNHLLPHPQCNYRPPLSASEVMQDMRTYINNKKEETSASGNNNTRKTKSDKYYVDMNKEFENNFDVFEAIYFYGYELEIDKDIDNEIFSEVNNFVLSGIC